MGIGGAVQLTFTFVMCELVPNKHRAYIDSALFFCIIPFAALGPVIGELTMSLRDFKRLIFKGRLLATKTAAGWRWFYYLNIMTCGISIILFLCFYFPPNYHQLHTRISKREQFKKIDYLGIVRKRNLFLYGLDVLIWNRLYLHAVLYSLCLVSVSRRRFY
jgi:MFS family permease